MYREGKKRRKKNEEYRESGPVRQRKARQKVAGIEGLKYLSKDADMVRRETEGKIERGERKMRVRGEGEHSERKGKKSERQAHQHTRTKQQLACTCIFSG